jgi:hypothetical protein
MRGAIGDNNGTVGSFNRFTSGVRNNVGKLTFKRNPKPGPVGK